MNNFVISIFKYYNDFKKGLICYDLARLLINDFLNIKKSNVQFKEQPTKPNTLININKLNEKTEQRKQQTRDYYIRNKQKFKKYKLTNDEKIKQYQKEYRNKQK